jgi:hypothetical protein
METSVQGPSTVHRAISLIAVVTVTFGIGLAAYDTVGRPASIDAHTPGAASPARPTLSGNNASVSPAPRFERSNEPAIEFDSLNAHGG